MTELKPCPFCNNNEYLFIRAKCLFNFDKSVAIYIECKCGLLMYEFADDYVDLNVNRENLANKWNSRT